MCPDLEQTEQQEQQILPRSHLEWEIKLASDKRGICRLGNIPYTPSWSHQLLGKKATTESNKNLLELGLSELFSGRDQPEKGHWVAAHSTREMERAQPDFPAEQGIPLAADEAKSLSQLCWWPSGQPWSPPNSTTHGAAPTRVPPHGRGRQSPPWELCSGERLVPTGLKPQVGLGK